jgi:SAM-dependent methyltransferase
VIASECIEHTLNPRLAVREIHRVTRPGGVIVITVPNQRWHFAVAINRALKLRPFQGYENWLRWNDLEGELRAAGARIEEMRGFHLLPPIVPVLRPLLRRLDAYGRALGPIMVNLAVLARK